MSDMINISLPNTPEVRDMLIQLGSHAADDGATFWEEEGGTGDAKARKKCALMAEAYRLFHDKVASIIAGNV